MKPYYEDDAVTLYHGDALDLLPQFAPSSVKAVVTDPPYVIGAVSAGNMASKSGGWQDMMNSAGWFTSWYRLVDRVLHSSGSFWTFLNWRTLPVVMRAALDAQLPITSCAVSYELFALMAQPGFNIEDRGLPDVWRQKVGSYKEHGHPAEKPEPLVRRIIDACNLWGVEQETVLDPFAGSGTTLAAAKKSGVRSIGIESEERWCEVAALRVSQQTLDFAAPPATVDLQDVASFDEVAS